MASSSIYVCQSACQFDGAVRLVKSCGRWFNALRFWCHCIETAQISLVRKFLYTKRIYEYVRMSV